MHISGFRKFRTFTHASISMGEKWKTSVVWYTETGNFADV